MKFIKLHLVSTSKTGKDSDIMFGLTNSSAIYSIIKLYGFHSIYNGKVGQSQVITPPKVYLNYSFIFVAIDCCPALSIVKLSTSPSSSKLKVSCKPASSATNTFSDFAKNL